MAMDTCNWKKMLGLVLLLAGSFSAGSLAGTLTSSSHDAQKASAILSSSSDWGLSFPEKGKPPVTNATVEELKQYDTYYMEDTQEKKMYLTFDCGYENGNTEMILDALKKHNALATFFVVGHFLKSEPALIRRMVEEGHIVGNHTWSHPDMTKISTQDAFSRELSHVEELYKETTGKDMGKFYRPPQGKYSTENLKMAQQLGYKTFFWSLAYVDWQQDQQPSKEEAFDKLLNRAHPGAIVLLHNTSSTNGQIMEELLQKWEDMGYTFHSLKELVSETT